LRSIIIKCYNNSLL